MCELLQILHALEECSFEQWYDMFIEIAIPSSMLPIPNEVINYVREYEDIYLTESYHDSNPDFSEYTARITEIINNLWNGKVFFKTRWHHPKDSSKIAMYLPENLITVPDLYKILKLSCTTHRDLYHYGLPRKYLHMVHCSDCCHLRNIKLNDQTGHFLVFKEWHNVKLGTEFRCFVRHRNLIAISPRFWPNYDPLIDEHAFTIRTDIVRLFKEHIKMKFPLYNFAFDVIRWETGTVQLLDFSPFYSCLTDSLAYNWAELNYDSRFLQEDVPEFRAMHKTHSIEAVCIID